MARVKHITGGNTLRATDAHAAQAAAAHVLAAPDFDAATGLDLPAVILSASGGHMVAKGHPQLRPLGDVPITSSGSTTRASGALQELFAADAAWAL